MADTLLVVVVVVIIVVAVVAVAVAVTGTATHCRYRCSVESATIQREFRIRSLSLCIAQPIYILLPDPTIFLSSLFSVFFYFSPLLLFSFFFSVIYSHVFIYLFSIPSSSFPLFFPFSFSPFSFLPDNQRSIVPWTFRDVELCDERSNDRVTRCVPGGSGDDDRSQSRDPIRVNPVIGVLLSSGEYINK